jgi:HB1, ASXL, restriction endonuclease HTH domain
MDEARRSALQAELENAISKRDQLQAVIAYLSEQLGEQVVNLQGTAKGQSSAKGTLSVRAGEFFGMSSTVATRAVLERAGRTQPMRTEEILDYITRGGVKLGGKDPAGTLYRSLQRDESFFRPARGVWGLAAWYPNQAAKKARDADLMENDLDPEGASQAENEPVTA